MFKEFTQLSQNKGWNVGSENSILESFINKSQLKEQFFAYAVEMADIENQATLDLEYSINEDKVSLSCLEEVKIIQGWNDDSMNSMYFNFIEEKKLEKNLANFAKEYN